MEGIGPLRDDCCNLSGDRGLVPNRRSVSTPRLHQSPLLGSKMAAESVDQVQQFRQGQRRELGMDSFGLNGGIKAWQKCMCDASTKRYRY